MKLTYLFVLFFLLFTASSLAQAPIEWQKALGGSKEELVESIEATTDGGYIVAASSQSTNGNVAINKGDHDLWIIKTDDTGKILWQRTYGGSGKDIAANAKPTADGGFIVAATTLSVSGDVQGNHGKADMWVLKLDATGSIQWQKCYGGPEDDEAASVLPTPDGGYVLFGKTLSGTDDVTAYRGAGDLWVVKLDAIGAIQWQQCRGGSGAEKAGNIALLADGGYIIAGATFSNNFDVSGNHGDFDYWVVALNSDGTLRWQNTLGGSGNDEATDIIVASDGGYVVAGYSYSKDGQVTGNHGLHDYWIVKLDKAGTLQWQRSAGGSQTDIPNSIVQNSDGSYTVAGTTYSFNGDINGNKGSYDYWIATLSSGGVLERQLCLGGTTAETATSIRQTADGKWIIAGEAYSSDGDVTGQHGNKDVWIVKLQSVPLGIAEIKGHNLVTYPEPVRDILHFNTSFEHISVYSLDGRKVLESSHSDKIGTHGLPSGMYLLQVLDQSKQVTVKTFVKQ